MNTSTSTSCDVLVIGAGIIGSMTAAYLQREGRSVLLLERETVASGASGGNAGILAYPEITPIAAPGIMHKAPRWLFDPLGPLSVRPAYIPRLTPWLWRFWKASSPTSFARTIAIETEMMRLAQSEMHTLAEISSLSPHFRKTGTLDLYGSESSLQAASGNWDAKAKAGFVFERIDRAEIERLQPGLSPRFQHAIWSSAGMQINEPRLFTEAIAQWAVCSGTQIVHGQADSITAEPNTATVKLSDGRHICARTVIVACGAWSRQLAASLGDIVPLDTERGYNTTLPPQSFEIQRQLYFNDHGFVVTPLSSGIRIGGAVEFGGLHLPPNFRRSQALLEKAKLFLPDLQTDGGRQWMGFRPSLPDCLPVIGRSSASQNILYAFGHGHLGLTQSAATARLMTELACDQAPSLNLAPLAADRFSRHRHDDTRSAEATQTI